MSKSFLYHVGWPVNQVEFNPADDLFVVGGGGQGGSGVKNTIAIYRIDDSAQKLVEVTKLELSTDEDAPTTLAIHPEKPIIACGINASDTKIQSGENKNTRIFEYSNENIHLIDASQTSNSKSINDWQSVARFSLDGTFLATGSTDGQLTILKFPSLTPPSPPIILREIHDLDISTNSTYLAIVTSNSLYLYTLINGQEVQKIENPLFNKKACEFRAVRFGKGKTLGDLFTVVNPKSRNRGFIVRWKVSGLKRQYHGGVSNRPIVSFAISADGGILAHASSDLTVGITDALTLQPLLKIPAAHTFAITALAFSPLSKYLVSASADSSIRVIALPEKFPRDNSILWAVLIVLFAVLVVVVYMFGVPNEIPAEKIEL